MIKNCKWSEWCYDLNAETMLQVKYCFIDSSIYNSITSFYFKWIMQVDINMAVKNNMVVYKSTMSIYILNVWAGFLGFLFVWNSYGNFYNYESINTTTPHKQS